MKVVSLFSGCGGMDLGFQGDFDFNGRHYDKTDFDVIWANDIDKHACETYRKNLGDHIVCGDIRDLHDQMPASCDVVIGGFPCQDFSVAGKRRGLDAPRGQLSNELLKAVDRLRPELFVAENVPGFMTSPGAYLAFEAGAKAIGYSLTPMAVNARECGIPQRRQRTILMGSKTWGVLEVDWEHSQRISLGKVIGDLEDVEEGGAPNHFWSKAKMCEGTQGNTRVCENRTAPTIRAEHHGNIEWHWNGERRLSARECARIQSFPDDFIFYPSTSQAYRQIGNAVPPVLAWHLADVLKSVAVASA